jgi:hypothetical protein
MYKNDMNKKYHPRPQVFSNVPQPRIHGYITGHTFNINYPLALEFNCPGYSAKNWDLDGLPNTMHFIP